MWTQQTKRSHEGTTNSAGGTVVASSLTKCTPSKDKRTIIATRREQRTGQQGAVQIEQNWVRHYDNCCVARIGSIT
jgi:hypothetical protein